MVVAALTQVIVAFLIVGFRHDLVAWAGASGETADLAARYLATGLFPSAVRWRVETPNRRNDDWLLCLPETDYRFVLRRYLDGDH